MKGYFSKKISEWTPEIVFGLSNYSFGSLLCDVRAGLLVSVVAFPLFMTFAIASGVAPHIGVITCIVAGTLICLCGGARFQIVGPTGAFAMIVHDIIKVYNFDGMTCALLMAGVMMILFGLMKVGDLIHYIPYPITAGFTAGIGLSIIASQLNVFLGLHVESMPTNFVERLSSCWTYLHTMNVYSCGLAIFSLIFMAAMQKYKPNLPKYFFVLILGVICSLLLPDAGMETIGSKFGDISDLLLRPSMPQVFINLEEFKKLFPSAFAIAFLGSLESLMGAVISDNLSGQKHRSNMELLGQGIANLGAGFFGGIPATCALSTTALNVKVGAKTPVAGLCCVAFIVLFVLCLGKFVKIIPMACLSAMLLNTAWNMAALRKTKYILLAPKSDSFVFIVTVLITLLMDIVVAVEVGLVLSAFLFIKRSVETTTTETFLKVIAGKNKDKTECECVRICGHLFFGAAPILYNALKSLPHIHDIVYIDMQNVPFVDASGAKVLREFVTEMKCRNIEVIIGGLNKRIIKVLKKMDLNGELLSHLSEEKI
ncbi:MAG: STAS domain-containing protein [Holosporaceae bacterium]|jgi:SulP family sulfate permease|nr:STAS domain-containing protein [Holosporaceae bacterium]